MIFDVRFVCKSLLGHQSLSSRCIIDARAESLVSVPLQRALWPSPMFRLAAG